MLSSLEFLSGMAFEHKVMLVVTAAVFILFGLLGWKSRDSDGWSLVDVLYYPLAAIGIILLFIHNEGQRELIHLESERVRYFSELGRIDARKPKLETYFESDFLESTRGMLKPIIEFSDICSLKNEQCFVAKALSEVIRPYVLSLKNDAGKSKVDHIVEACQAADQILVNLSQPSGALGVYGAKVGEIYKDISLRDLGAVALPVLLLQVDGLKTLFKQTEQVSEEDGVRDAQLRYSAVVLLGLLPCITSSDSYRKEVVAWNSEKIQVEGSLAKIDSRVTEIKNGVSRHPAVYAWAIGYWPVFLLVGLTLKFGKAISGAKPLYVRRKMSSFVCFFKKLSRRLAKK